MRLSTSAKRRFAIEGRGLSEDRETLHWEAGWALAAGAVLAAGVLAALPVIVAPLLGGAVVLGLPVGYLIGGLVAPLGIVAVLFFFAVSQNQLDRRFGNGDG
jgi:putative solute:sodium symporter small subunit